MSKVLPRTPADDSPISPHQPRLRHQHSNARLRAAQSNATLVNRHPSYHGSEFSNNAFGMTYQQRLDWYQKVDAGHGVPSASGPPWVGRSTQHSPQVVDLKVRAWLNKLSPDTFDTVSDQVIAWANRSEKESDGRTLLQVLLLIFEGLTDDPDFPQLYARLCRKMMDEIAPGIRVKTIKDESGKPLTGPKLFKRYLLKCCQQDFERGSQADSDETYKAQKARRRWRGLLLFMGELYRLQVLTERIMHVCIKKLLGTSHATPPPEDIEALCRLFNLVGQDLDTIQAADQMDLYISRMASLSMEYTLTPRLRYMLQDVIDARHRNWMPKSRNLITTSRTEVVAHQIRENVANDQPIANTHPEALQPGIGSRAQSQPAGPRGRPALQRTESSTALSRPGSKNGQMRGSPFIGPDGWALSGPSSRSRGAPAIPPSAPADLGAFPPHPPPREREKEGGPSGHSEPMSLGERIATPSHAPVLPSLLPVSPMQGIASIPPITPPPSMNALALSFSQHQSQLVSQQAPYIDHPPLSVDTKTNSTHSSDSGVEFFARPGQVLHRKRSELQASTGRPPTIVDMVDNMRPSSRMGHGSRMSDDVPSPSAFSSMSSPRRRPSIEQFSAVGPGNPRPRKLSQLGSRPNTVRSSSVRPSTGGSDHVDGALSPDSERSSMSSEQAEAKIRQDAKEFFNLHELDGAEWYFSSLPPVHRHRLVHRFTIHALESRESDATLVARLFWRAAEKGLCTAVQFETGFVLAADTIDEIAFQKPEALQLFARMLAGTRLERAALERIAAKSINNERLLGLLS